MCLTTYIYRPILPWLSMYDLGWMDDGWMDGWIEGGRASIGARRMYVTLRIDRNAGKAC